MPLRNSTRKSQEMQKVFKNLKHLEKKDLKTDEHLMVTLRIVD